MAGVAVPLMPLAAKPHPRPSSGAEMWRRTFDPACFDAQAEDDLEQIDKLRPQQTECQRDGPDTKKVASATFGLQRFKFA